MASPFSEQEIREALERAGLEPACHDMFVDFQMRFGGKQDDIFGLNTLVWGILHRTPSWMEAGLVDVFDNDGPVLEVPCADVHPSDQMTLDVNGGLYWGGWLTHHQYDDYFSGRRPFIRPLDD